MHCYTLTNLHGFLFLFVIASFKHKLNKDEKTMFFLLAVGLLMLLLDPWSYRLDTLTERHGRLYKRSAVWVDLVLVLSNFVAAGFFMLNKLLMKDRAAKHFI